MNNSSGHSPQEASLHDALHASVQEDGTNAAGPYLIGLADDALKVARRWKWLLRTAVGVGAAAVAATAWMTFADGTTRPAPPVVQPAAEGTANANNAAQMSIWPVTSSIEQACTQGSGGYSVPPAATHAAFCIHADRAKGMTDIRVASAKPMKSGLDGAWQVKVTLNSADRTRFAALTKSIAAAPSPRNEFVIVIGGKLLGHPMVRSSITSGRLEIVGAFEGDLTRATAHNLALKLDASR